MKTAILYVLVGERDEEHLFHSIQLVRKYDKESAIIVLTDNIYLRINPSVEVFRIFTRRKHDKREENRNSSEMRLEGLLHFGNKYDCICYMDNDIYVVQKWFFNGFKIGQKYGLCMPINPRDFVKTANGKHGDLDIGTDVHPYDIENTQELPEYTTAHNMGVIFYNCHDVMATRFLKLVLEEQRKEQSRGQAALARALQRTSYYPYTLAQQFLACRDIDRPLAIHAGRPEMLKLYKEGKYNV